MASAAVATATATSSSPIPASGAATPKSSLSENANGTGKKTEPSSDCEQPLTQPKYHKQQPDKAIAVASMVPGETERTAPPQPPLPTDLRKIILEVARTGTHGNLPWANYGSGRSKEASSDHSSSTSHQHIPMNGGFTRQSFSTNGRSGYSSYRGGIAAQASPRKKQRNGLHKSNRRRLDAKAGRKRPLFLIRTSHNPVNNQNVTAPGSVGSGRTSGSEPDDSTQYECDSEGTSATTNSEVSVERLRKSQQLVNESSAAGSRQAGIAAARMNVRGTSSDVKTLHEAFRIALGLVLDHFYQNCGGYKLSPAEKRQNENTTSSIPDKHDSMALNQSPEHIFQQRRQKLLGMVSSHADHPDRTFRLKSPTKEGPPFTIQRVAEVLVSPERVSLRERQDSRRSPPSYVLTALCVFPVLYPNA